MIPNPLQSAATARPEHTALLWQERLYSWRQLADIAAAKAGSLAAAGVRPGDVVALAGDFDATWVEAFYALLWLGACVAPLDRKRVERSQELRSLAPSVVLCTRDENELGSANQLLWASLPWAEPLAARPWGPQEARTIVLTSGSTGSPKPVTLTTEQLVYSAFGSAIRLGHHLDDRWLLCLPLHHVGGLSVLFRCTLYATSIRLLSGYDAPAISNALDLGDTSLVSLVPEQLAQVLDLRKDKPFSKRLRVVLLGGAMTPAALVARCKAQKIPIATSWGMSEAASQVATSFPGEAQSAMPPLPFVSLSLEEGGVLCLEGPQVGLGRHTSADRGELTEGGWVRVLGRLDRVLVSGGEKISLEELEQQLLQHPDVAEVRVQGLPHVQWGQRPIALLVARGERMASEDALRGWCRGRMARHKVPDRFVWLRRLPRNAMGKLSQQLLSRICCDFWHIDACAPKGFDKLWRNGSGAKALQIDTGLNDAHPGTQHAIDTDDFVGRVDRGLADVGAAQRDIEAISDTNRREVVGLGMHDRKPPAAESDGCFNAS